MNPELQLLLWVAGSFAIGPAAVAYVYRSGGGWRHQALVESDLGGMVVEVALFMYHIGLPFLALIGGALSVDLLGLGAIAVEGAPTLAGFTPRDWMRSSIAAALAAGFVLIVVWMARRAAGAPPSLSTNIPGLLPILRDAAYAEVHWAFYRAPFALLLQDAYWGTAAGFVLVATEWLLMRWLRRAPAHADRPHTLTMTCCALTSGLLYLIARNLWLMIAAHAAIRWAGGRLLTRAAQPAAPQT
ncbi:MAG: hypothetical protein RMN52_11655 [Anaerolineae bacterium]|nr:hypothetical protein [Candidatus Roseilinea sp.]MDW8450645.1 hypothetical protein [Anaerolineae bacterium]